MKMEEKRKSDKEWWSMLDPPLSVLPDFLYKEADRLVDSDQLIPCLSNFSMHQNILGSLLKNKISGKGTEILI